MAPGYRLTKGKLTLAKKARNSDFTKFQALNILSGLLVKNKSVWNNNARRKTLKILMEKNVILKKGQI